MERRWPTEEEIAYQNELNMKKLREIHPKYRQVETTPLHLGKLATTKTELGRLMDEEAAAKQAETEKNSGLGYV